MDSFKAMGDPTRRQILKLLSTGDKNAGEIADQFTMSKPAISKHLEILKNADLITMDKRGQFILYSLNTSAVENFISGIFTLFDGIEVKKQHEETNAKSK